MTAHGTHLDEGLQPPSVIVPLITPLLADHRVDLDSLSSLLDYVLGHGVDGVLALGSSGECVTLSAAQRFEVARHVVSYTSDRAHVMLGVPAWGDADAMGEARRLAELAPDSLLICAPAGMRLSADEIAAHYRSFAGLDVPVIAYDVPSRVSVDLDPVIIGSLAADGVIRGLKDSSGDIVKARRFADATRAIEGFARYTGCEEVIDGSLLIGYHGGIPGLANVFPEWHVGLVAAAQDNRWVDATALQGDVVELLELYSCELPAAGFVARFLGAVKEALRQLGVITTSTTSSVLVQPDRGLADHVSRVLDRADVLREARASVG